MNLGQMSVSEFEAAISGFAGCELEFPYRDIAGIFASSEPHPYTMEYKNLDFDALKKSANSAGWDMHILKDKGDPNIRRSPAIRLSRIFVIPAG